MNISYAIEEQLGEQEFTELLRSSSLGARRPLDQPARIRKMCQNASLLVTARLQGKLIGVARSLTDFAYCTYLSDLAVAEESKSWALAKSLSEEHGRLLRKPPSCCFLHRLP